MKERGKVIQFLTQNRGRGEKKKKEREREREGGGGGLFYYGTLHLLPNLKSQTNQIQIKRMNNYLYNSTSGCILYTSDHIVKCGALLSRLSLENLGWILDLMVKFMGLEVVVALIEQRGPKTPNTAYPQGLHNIRVIGTSPFWKKELVKIHGVVFLPK